jgi:hypothetical protein
MCSMISGQCDKLRETADEIQRIKNNNADWLWRDAATLADAAGQLRDAADLILELRDGLQQANAENARLRSCLSDDAENARLIMGENARLRELALARFACDSDACESCADCQLSGNKPFRCVEVARELCVEVDG